MSGSPQRFSSSTAGPRRALSTIGLVALMLCVPARSLADRCGDTMRTVIDRRAETQFAPIGELETESPRPNYKGVPPRWRGTGVLISPCYVITNHHVAYGPDDRPIPSKNYRMLFHFGVTKTAAFNRHTVATPLPDKAGSKGILGANDWAILKLTTCVGANLGWFETDNVWNLLEGDAEVAALGYAGDTERGAPCHSGWVRSPATTDIPTCSNITPISSLESRGAQFS